MTRLRALRLRSWLLPLLLGSFALRVLIPSGAMPAAGIGIQSSMCSTESGRSELIEIPDASPKPHCDRCLLTPPFEAPYAFLGPVFTPSARLPLVPERVSQIPEAPLARAQSARAPPHA